MPTQGWEESQLCSSYPPPAFSCERQIKQFLEGEILSPVCIWVAFWTGRMQSHAVTKEAKQRKEVGVRCLRENRKIIRDNK